MGKLPVVEWTPDYKENAQFYDEERENLRYESIDEYMSECAMEERDETIATLLNEDHVFEVFGHNRDMPSHGECEFLDDLMERLEDERSGEDFGHVPFKKSEFAELKALESTFINELLKRYKPWSCKPVVVVNVPFRAWFDSQSEAYRRELLDDDKGDEPIADEFDDDEKNDVEVEEDEEEKESA